MKLPKDILSGLYTKPNFFLCQTDKEKICKLETTNTNGSFKFHSLSEISFEIARVYNDIITGETKTNPYYDLIEALRLVYVEGFGYFELQGPELISDGIQEKKSCTAYSSEYTLAQKYLENFYINMGTVESIEVINASSEKNIVPIVLYDPANPKLSLLNLVLSEIYGWKIGHVDPALRTLSRQFEVDRESVYDFLMNEVCEKFNCYIVFDTINNTINVYAESLTAKFIGDGKTNTFTIAPPFSQIGTVSVDGYKTTRWKYNLSTGALTLEDVPESGAHIEVVDGALTEWETDVFVSFDNLSQEVNINYDADAIKTQLTVTYGDDYDIREANLGLPYLTDISYYYTVDWMGQDLYDAYTKYMQKSNSSQAEYTKNSQEILKWNDHIAYEENRLSLEYSLVESVNSSTVGTYYTRQQNLDGSYYYSEVSLPNEYIVDVDYYSNVTTNVNEEKVGNLYTILKKYFYAYFNEDSDGITDMLDELKGLLGFDFIDGYTLLKLHDDLKSATTIEDMDAAVHSFLQELWPELGRTPLRELYLEPYKKVQETNINAGWSNTSSKNYGEYYPVILFISSIESAIAQRDLTIKNYKDKQSVPQNANAEISDSLLMKNNFTEAQLIRLSAFLREDELHLDDIVETGLEDLSSSFKIKQDAMESGRIELQRISQPQLQFSMTMANIYALPEFEPIINQFQLGRVIRVCLRPDYIKQSRLLQVNINFDDFSDFSCEFGELTSLRTQSDIHADLLSNAISAGKSVATNSSYWTRGSDVASSIDLKIQQGLLDATTQIKAIDGSQGVVIDKYGIKLQKKLENGELDPHQTWLVNNMILMSDDGFKTSRSALGQVTVDGQEYYGLIAEMILSGYIEGSRINGGTIQIGEYIDSEGNKQYAFEVDKNGNVSMCSGTVQFSTEKNSLADLEESIPTKTSELENDSGYQNETGIVSIIDGTVNADFVNALNVKAGSVDAENITGTTITGKSIEGGDLLIGDKSGNYAEITNDGVLNCNGANIIGGITATDGQIGGWTIKDGYLYAENEEYIPPERDEVSFLLRHISFPDSFPLPSGHDVSMYDFNGDGKLNRDDVVIAHKISQGLLRFEDCPNAEKSVVSVTINPSDVTKTICVSGTNMWGRKTEYYIGTNMGNSEIATKGFVDISLSEFYNEYVGDVATEVTTLRHELDDLTTNTTLLEGRVASLESKNIDHLWSGSLSDGNITFPYSTDYKFYIIQGLPGVGDASVSMVVPTSLITSTSTVWQISDESYFVSFGLSQADNIVTLERRMGNGTINNVFGVA